jgi:hypothetical protein
MNTEYQMSLYFLINAYDGAKYCPSGIETGGIHVPAWNICNFPVLNYYSNRCPSDKCASAAN